MKTILNILWFILGGWIVVLLWGLVGVLLIVTILFSPFGFQCLKIAGYAMWPFGRDILSGRFGAFGFLANVVWILLVGIELAVIHVVLGLLFFVTLIGIPFGVQHMKLAKLCLLPFGASIVHTRDFG